MGERIAMAGAHAEAGIAACPDERRFLRRQSRQERLHAVLFQSAAWALMPDSGRLRSQVMPPALMRVRARLREAIARGAYREAIIIQHVALEGLGHVVLEILSAELVDLGGGFDSARRLILAHEDTHYAFGVRLLAAHADDANLRQLADAMRDEAECLLQSLAAQFHILGGDITTAIELLHQQAETVSMDSPR